MTLPNKTQLMATGLPAGTVNELENEVPGLSGTNAFTGANTFTLGSSTGTFGTEGNLNVQVSAAGVSPAAGSAGSGDLVLAAYTVPASAFSAAGKGITIMAAGSFGATSNVKLVKLWVNPATAVVGATIGASGVLICSTASVTTNGTGWQIEGSLFKYGAAGSNTQIGLHNQAQVGAAVASMLAPNLVTATENGTVLVAITGYASTTVTDVVFNFLQVNATN